MPGVLIRIHPVITKGMGTYYSSFFNEHIVYMIVDILKSGGGRLFKYGHLLEKIKSLFFPDTSLESLRMS